MDLDLPSDKNASEMKPYDDLRKVLKLQRRDSLGRSGRLQSALNEHRNILKALIKRDGAAAQEAMQAHLARGLEATR